jgi:hypothetical protein
MLLFDHLQMSQPSLQQHSFSLLTKGGEKVSKQAIDKRFNANTVCFIKTLFENYMHRQLKPLNIPSGLKEKFKAIRIMDATSYQLPASLAEAFPGFTGDGTAACAKLQFEYELLSGKIETLCVQHARMADKTFAAGRINTLQAGELVLRDLGYYSVDMYKEIEEQGAFYISRLKQQVIIYEKKKDEYQELSYKEIIKRVRRAGQKYLDMEVYIGKERKHRVRMIVNLLDGQAIARRLKRKKHYKQQLNNNDRQSCQVNIFITNVGQQTIAAENIFKIYKLRWQIELVFKSWKSVLKIQEVRKMQVARFQCYVYSKLLWIVISWDLCCVASADLYSQKEQLISIYKCFALLKQQAYQFEDLLFKEGSGLYKYLKKLNILLIDFAGKETRNNRTNLIDLLVLNK